MVAAAAPAGNMNTRYHAAISPTGLTDPTATADSFVFP